VNDRPGFLSPLGGLLAVATVVGVLLWTLLAGRAPFSAGPLNAQARASALGGVTSHAQLAGDCEACHTPPWSSQTMASRCVACHKDVGAEIRSRSGLHGKLVGGTTSPTCRGCHVDHRGAAAALTVGGPDFPHELTGYSLAGHRDTSAGAKVGCGDCHPAGLGRFDVGTCADCHARANAAFMREHRTRFGAECLTCHDGTGRFGSDFDHGRLPFKLTGRHATVPCNGCHAGATTIAAFRAAPRACGVCHARNDKHGGKFGKQCGQCHSTSAWTGARFDHSIFPLDHGREERTPTCATCHPSDVSSYTCYGCHAHTPASVQGEHEGRSLAELTDCIRCHAGGRSEGGD
jgi:hypothetical protein